MTKICKGDSILLNATYTNANSGVKYIWLLNGNRIDSVISSFLYAKTSGQYNIITIDSCSIDTSSAISTTFYPLPSFSIFSLNNTSNCIDKSLIVTVDNYNLKKYKWSTGDTTKYTYVNINGYYSLAVQDTNNCILHDSIFINNYYNSTVDTAIINQPSSIFLCKTNNISLTGKNVSSYKWYNYKRNTVWLENFSYPNNTIQGSGNPPKWTRYVKNTGFSDTYLMTQGSKMQACRTGNEAYLTTQSINIKGLTNVDISVTLSSAGTFSSPKKSYIKAYYKLDNNPEILFYQNGSNYGSIGPLILAKQNMLNGDSLKIIIRLFCDIGEYYQFDNIIITGLTKNVLSYNSILNYIADTNDVVFLVDTTKVCSFDSVQINVSNNPPLAQLNVGVTSNVCTGDSLNIKVIPNQAAQYYWYHNGSVIPSGSNSIYAKQIGSYKVIMKNGCGSDTSQVTNLINYLVPAKPVITQNGSALSSNYASGNQWFLNGTIIIGANQTIYNPIISGNYSVKYTDSNGCTIFSDPFPFFPSSVYNLDKENNIIIYPNPAFDRVSIHFKQLQKTTYLYMYNSIGALVYNSIVISTQEHSIDLSSFSQGVYFLVINNNSLSFKKKISILH